MAGKYHPDKLINAEIKIAVEKLGWNYKTPNDEHSYVNCSLCCPKEKSDGCRNLGCQVFVNGRVSGHKWAKRIKEFVRKCGAGKNSNE